MSQNHLISAPELFAPIRKELISLSDLLQEYRWDETDQTVNRITSSSQGRSNSDGTQEGQKPQLKLLSEADSCIRNHDQYDEYKIHPGFEDESVPSENRQAYSGAPQVENDRNASDTSEDEAKKPLTARKKVIRKASQSKAAHQLQAAIAEAKTKSIKVKNPADERWKRLPVLLRTAIKKKIQEATVLIDQLQLKDPRMSMLVKHNECWQYALNSLPKKRLELPFVDYLQSWSTFKKGHQHFYIKFQELCNEVGNEIDESEDEVTKQARRMLRPFLSQFKPK